MSAYTYGCCEDEDQYENAYDSVPHAIIQIQGTLHLPAI